MGLLRSLFGPSQQEIWTQVASEVGGSYVEGGLFDKAELKVQTADWEIVLDTYTVSTGKSQMTFTRMTAPYLNAEGFSFRVYRSTVFTRLAKLLGTKDIEVGDPLFDDTFVIQGNNDERVQALFANQQIKDLALMQPAFHLQVSDSEGFFGRKYGPAVDRLLFEVPGVVKNAEVLRGLFELFGAVLDEVCARGAAYRDRNPLPDNPLPAGTSAALQEMWAVVNFVTRDLYGRAERVGDTIEARVVVDRPVELRAQIVVTEPVLPGDTADITFVGQLPALIDVRAYEEAVRERVRRRGQLVRVIDESVHVQVKELLRADVQSALHAVVDGWRALVVDAAGSRAD